MDSTETAIRESSKANVRNAEGVTYLLIEQFSRDVFPSPHQFSDRQIAIIGGWAGHDDKGTFGGHGYAPGYRDIDHKIIDEYNLDVSEGENTWPKFAAFLKSRKEAWAASHPNEAGLRRGRELLEEAIEECAVAGMTQTQIMREARNWCEEICE